MIDLYGSMTRQHCIAKDGIHPNTKGVEAIIELYRSVSDEQFATVGNKDVEDSESEADKEQHFWLPRNTKQTPPAAPEVSKETTLIQGDQTSIMEPLFSGDARDHAIVEISRKMRRCKRQLNT